MPDKKKADILRKPPKVEARVVPKFPTEAELKQLNLDQKEGKHRAWHG